MNSVVCIHGSIYPHEYTIQCCSTLTIKCMSCISYKPTSLTDIIICDKCKGVGWYLQTCPYGRGVCCNQPVTMYCPGGTNGVL